MRSPTKALNETTPEQAWSGGDKVNLSHLRVFGSRAFCLFNRIKTNGINRSYERSLITTLISQTTSNKGCVI
jgi:hypothetical protein